MEGRGVFAKGAMYSIAERKMEMNFIFRPADMQFPKKNFSCGFHIIEL
jgi:hypothetical protein